MKKCLVLIAIVMLHLPGRAAVLTVDNNAGATAEYTQVTDAVAAASPGDTIHVAGSPTTYTAVVIEKPLTVIGPGFWPQKDNPVPATIGSVVCNEGSDGSTIMGIVSGAIGIQDAGNIRVEGCMFTYYMNFGSGNSVNLVGVHDILIRGNAIVMGIGHAVGWESSNVIVENNLFYEGSSFSKVTSFTNASMVFRNNIFHGISFPTFTGCSNLQVHNNIFYDREPTGCSNCVFLNNLTYQTDATLPEEDGNLAGDPLFLEPPTSATYFNYGADYHLQDSSPARDAGTDGTDMGVYGGMTPYRHGGEPPIPKISKFNILNTAVPPGGQLNIEVESISVK